MGHAKVPPAAAAMLGVRPGVANATGGSGPSGAVPSDPSHAAAAGAAMSSAAAQAQSVASLSIGELLNSSAKMHGSPAGNVETSASGASGAVAADPAAGGAAESTNTTTSTSPPGATTAAGRAGAAKAKSPFPFGLNSVSLSPGASGVQDAAKALFTVPKAPAIMPPHVPASGGLLVAPPTDSVAVPPIHFPGLPHAGVPGYVASQAAALQAIQHPERAQLLNKTTVTTARISFGAPPTTDGKELAKKLLFSSSQDPSGASAASESFKQLFGDGYF